MRIAVAGGSGPVGAQCVDTLRARGHEVSILSRRAGIDLRDGSGLVQALDGMDTVLDVTNVMTLSRRRARTFFQTVTTNLLRAERRAGVTHHLILSIVGIDGVDAAYYAGKLAQEQRVLNGDTPFTIARATQFHEFAGQLLDTQRGPLALLPRTLVRPVAVHEVAERLAMLADAGPQGRVADLIGPRDEVLADLARRQLRADGITRVVREVRFPGAYGRCLASGRLRGDPTGNPGPVYGRTTFDDWLQARRRDNAPPR